MADSSPSSPSKVEARAALLADESDDATYQHYQSYQNYPQPGDISQTAPGGYHEREGFPNATPTNANKVPWLYIPNTPWSWAFLAAVVIQAVIGLALEAYIFARFEIGLENGATHNPYSRAVPTYLSLYLFGFVYQIFLSYDALRLSNTIQVVGLCIYNVGLLIEAAVQIDQIHDAVNRLTFPSDGNAPEIEAGFWGSIHAYILAVPCIIALFTVIMIGLSYKLYGEFAWSIYTQLSADINLKKRYLVYQIYIALLKFDVFFFLAFTVQFLVVVTDTTSFELGITVAALPITIALLILAAYWVKQESMWGMGVIIVFYVAGMAYFIFKLVRMYDSDPARIEDYLPARRSLTTFAVITLLLLIVTIVYAVWCTINFDSGLKPHVQSKRRRQADEEDKLYTGNVNLAVAPPARMEID